MAKARRRRIWSGSHDCLARVRRAAASKSGRRGTGAAMALLEQNWPPRNHTHAPKATPAHESHFRGVGIRWFNCLEDFETRLDFDAEFFYRHFSKRLLLRLHDVGQAGVAWLVEAQVGRQDSRELQDNCLKATIDLPCDREAISVCAHLRCESALPPAQQGRQHLASLVAVIVDSLLA